ncbi:heterokaryon incompatibility protein-domain-containing protein [Podospora fimiseda]|uniref:Heterokaryon incompatibility protein-domain-containing protein n=1 Tax=Podospora fimiseda TaxID=252190 RepID=A0AAN6YKB9_9PEZI|nr:heterokaryon incompatibility protein-domain-containing protein [Podospora fimiseda]
MTKPSEIASQRSGNSQTYRELRNRFEGSTSTPFYKLNTIEDSAKVHLSGPAAKEIRSQVVRSISVPSQAESSAKIQINGLIRNEIRSQVVKSISVPSQAAPLTPPPLPPRRIKSAPIAHLSASGHPNPNVQTLKPPPTPPRRGSNLSIQHTHTISDPDAKQSVVAEQLCGNCAEINFSQFHPSTPTIPLSNEDQHTPETTHLLPLKLLLDKRNSCRFCNLLFHTLSLPENDPLKDSEIQESIQKEPYFEKRRSPEAPFRVDFATWVNGREAIKWRFKKSAEAKWPFGITMDSIKVAEDEANKTANGEVDFEKDEDNKTEIAVLNQSTRVGLATAQQVDGNAQRGKFYGWTQAVLPDSGFLMMMSKNKVPAALRVVVYGSSHSKQGVIEVKLWGTSRAIGRELKLLSRFNLRVASPILAPTMDRQLRYGRLIRKDRIDLGLCRQWLHHCRTVHCDACQAPSWSINMRKTGTVNFRVIDVIQMTLVEKDASCCEYAALSYVWGTPDQYRPDLLYLNRSTVDKFFELNSITGSVGQTIWDAMEVVRGLGMRYLWADRMCIIQDSDQDKAKQIGLMDVIYGHATVTIAAATSVHLDSGLLGISTKRSVVQIAKQVTKSPQVNVLVPVESNPDLSPWSTRAWTLQEKLLSRRILLFHHGQVGYYCGTGTMHEDMSASDAGHNPEPIGWLSLRDNNLWSSVKQQMYGRAGPKLLRAPVFREYAGLIEQYTPRRMTNPSDAIHAVSGMLKILITNQRGRQLLHGLPEEFFDQAFHWQPSAAAEGNVRLRLRPGGTFPTWSWAAWEAVDLLSSGGVRYETPFQIQTDETGALLKVVERNIPEERMRPLIKWYIVESPNALPPPGPNKKIPPPLPPRLGSRFTKPITPPSKTAPSSVRPIQPGPSTTTLRPLNDTGLGLTLGSDVNLRNWNDSVHSVRNHIDKDINSSSIPFKLDQRSQGHHLVFRTYTTQFRLGPTRWRTEILWKRNKDSKLVRYKELEIRETAIFSNENEDQEIGRVVLPDPHEMPKLKSSSGLYDFIVISEAQFFGDEKVVEVGEWGLFNVMMVDRTPGSGGVSTRVGMGKITKDAWWAAGPKQEVVILG